MSDERLRTMQRQLATDPEDAEVSQALLAAQVRAGVVTRRDAQQGLVNALRGRFLRRMQRIKATPLGPFYGRKYERLTGLALNGSTIICLSLTEEEVLALEGGRGPAYNAALYEERGGGERWLWVIPSWRPEPSPNVGLAQRLRKGDRFQVEVEGGPEEDYRRIKVFTTWVVSVEPWVVRVQEAEDYTRRWNRVGAEEAYWTKRELEYRERVDTWE